MTMDEFKKHISVDFIYPRKEEDGEDVQALVIFSEGFSKTFSKDFVKSNRKLAIDMTAWDLFQMLTKEFRDG